MCTQCISLGYLLLFVVNTIFKNVPVCSACQWTLLSRHTSNRLRQNRLIDVSSGFFAAILLIGDVRSWTNGPWKVILHSMLAGVCMLLPSEKYDHCSLSNDIKPVTWPHTISDTRAYQDMPVSSQPLQKRFSFMAVFGSVYVSISKCTKICDVKKTPEN